MTAPDASSPPGSFLGVDAGGTAAEFLLATADGRELRVRTGSLKRSRVGEATAARHLGEALAGLEEQSGQPLRGIDCCIGTAGESLPAVTDWLSAAFTARLGRAPLILADVLIALDAAFPGGPGVLVLAGTGSHVAGRDRSGRMFRAGGLGPVLGDEGSGHAIGLEALRAGFRRADRGEPAPLLDALAAAWGLASRQALFERVNARGADHAENRAEEGAGKGSAPDFASLAPAVAAAAQAGDELASAVLAQAGSDLAGQAAFVLGRIAEGSAEPLPPVAVAGSILARIPAVRSALESRLRVEFPWARFLPEPADPVRGALWHARRSFSPS